MRKILLPFNFILVTSILTAQVKDLPYNNFFDKSPESDGWKQYRMGNDADASDWHYTGTGVVSHDYNVGGQNKDTIIDWYVSCPIRFMGASSVSVSVETSGFSKPFENSFDVWFSAGSPDPADGDFVKVANLSYMLPHYKWLDTTFQITQMAPEGGYIAFKFYTQGAAWATYAFDSLQISGPDGVLEFGRPEKQLDIYPNPIKDQALIQIPKEIEGNCELLVYSSTGKLILQRQTVGGRNLILKRADFPSGGTYIYHLKTEVDTYYGSGKFIMTE